MSSLADLIAEARLLVPGKLLDDEPLEEHNWNTMVDLCEKYNDVLSKIDNNIPPVNYIYIQFPGMPSPDVLWDQPSARWKNISGFFPGDFFRVEGGNASAFKEDI
ncbi:MAG: hypothetical protein LBI86_08120, partial [Treponema sp.]|nr:hypothetical protein [Treponema sp.]